MPSIETLLNAMCETYHADEFDDYEKASRQYRAFRSRILWMHRKRDFQAATSFELWTTERGIANDLRRQLKEKDQRIAELNDHSMKKESEANKYREEYAQAMKMLRDANKRIAELEEKIGEHPWRVTIMAPVPEPPPFDEGVDDD